MWICNKTARSKTVHFCFYVLHQVWLRHRHIWYLHTHTIFKFHLIKSHKIKEIESIIHTHTYTYSHKIAQNKILSSKCIGLNSKSEKSSKSKCNDEENHIFLCGFFQFHIYVFIWHTFQTANMQFNKLNLTSTYHFWVNRQLGFSDSWARLNERKFKSAFFVSVTQI